MNDLRVENAVKDNQLIEANKKIAEREDTIEDLRT